MAEVQRMTVDELVSYFLEGEGVEYLRESITCVCQQLMEAEVSDLVGAARGERAPEERLTHRNGYRSRAWQARAGEIELAIPKIRRSSYFPSFFEPRRRSEQALVSVVEAYFAGVSSARSTRWWSRWGSGSFPVRGLPGTVRHERASASLAASGLAWGRRTTS